MAAAPLKCQRIEAKPKRVNFYKFEDNLGVGRNARLLLEFNELQDCITNGVKLPDRFYRVDIDRSRDRLLEETGINHLHLGGRGSDIIVYLIQFDDRVILLRIDTHRFLEDEPRGSGFLKILGLRG